MKRDGLGFVQLDIFFPDCVNLKLLNGQKIKMLKLAFARIKPSTIPRPVGIIHPLSKVPRAASDSDSVRFS